MPRATHFKHLDWVLLSMVLTAILVSFGCGGGGNTTKAAYYGNYHPADWITAHPQEGVTSTSRCTTCHEMTVLRQGGAAPSCMTADCHHVSVANWPDGTIHGSRAKTSLGPTGGGFASCQTCHGLDFKGAGTGVSCASCHLVNAPHPPKPWLGQAGFNHATTDPSNAPACARCHFTGSPNNPANHPSTPAPAGTAPGCFNNTMCHGDASAGPHSSQFLLTIHPTTTQSTFSSDCITCHAVSGSNPGSSAPACMICHSAADPLVVANGPGTCLSCHASGPSGLPKGPTGSLTSFPNIEGAHAGHMALAGLACSTCHTGYVAGTSGHYTSANARVTTPTAPGMVAIVPSTYNAKSGTAGFTSSASALTCSNISCHGGQTTPGWQSGSLAANTACTSCHASGTGQYNSYNSGAHAVHMAQTGMLCTNCHNMTSGSSTGATNHFRFLGTQAMEGPAPTTVQPAENPSPTTYTSTLTCTLTCHFNSGSVSHQHTSESWFASGGVNHALPFVTSAHTGATTATFNANCTACHDISGPSTKTGPTCTTCHTVSPLSVAPGSCLSCHTTSTAGMPLGPSGPVFPDQEGAHAEHMALPTPVTCNTCHTNLGFGSAGHYAAANRRVSTPAAPSAVSFAAPNPFQAQSGGSNVTSSATTFTCSNISCHGGQTTPGWQSGTLVPSTACTSCHAVGSAQYNSANSGEHQKHVIEESIACTTCHDMSNGLSGAVNHFTTLNTPPMVDAANTIRPLPNGGSYNGTSCTAACHDPETW